MRPASFDLSTVDEDDPLVFPPYGSTAQPLDVYDEIYLYDHAYGDQAVSVRLFMCEKFPFYTRPDRLVFRAEFEEIEQVGLTEADVEKYELRFQGFNMLRGPAFHLVSGGVEVCPERVMVMLDGEPPFPHPAVVMLRHAAEQLCKFKGWKPPAFPRTRSIKVGKAYTKAGLGFVKRSLSEMSESRGAAWQAWMKAEALA